MLPYPPPLLPEPITVPGNVADGDYIQRVRFIRAVGLFHLATVLAIAGVVALFLKPSVMPYLAGSSPEAMVPVAFVSVLALSAARKAPLLPQLVILAIFLVSGSAALSFWIAAWHDSFPAFVEAVGVVAAVAYTALLAYNLFCGRDYSFGGEFVLSALAVVAAGVTVAFRYGLTVAETVTAIVTSIALITYWVYDLAMVIRRRTLAETPQAVVDLYRDLVNFVGFPVRILRMPRRKGRTAN